MTVPPPTEQAIFEWLTTELSAEIELTSRRFTARFIGVIKQLYPTDADGLFMLQLAALSANLLRMAAMMKDPDEGLELVQKTIFEDYETQQQMAKLHVDFHRLIREKLEAKQKGKPASDNSG